MADRHFDKVAIVTGASAPNGIGRAVAVRLASDGAAVVVTDVPGSMAVGDGTRQRMELLAGTVCEIEAVGGTGVALAVDITDAAQIATCVAETLRRFERIDILVNNAGTTVGTGPFLATDADDWSASFAVNLLGPTLFCQAVIPSMRDRGGGSIVNIGSTGSLGAEAGFGAYTAMKHGLIGLTKTIAAEFGVDGIRCNAICPGYVMTDMHAGANARIAAERGIDLDAVKAERYAGVALRRAGTPQEIADTVAFVAGAGAAYVTGAAIPVSGGTPVGL